MVMAKIVDEIEDYIPEVREYREKGISDATINRAFTEYLMNESCFIADLLKLEDVKLPTWVVIDIDKTLQELRHHGSEHIEHHGLVFPGWCIEMFLEDLETFLKELEEVE